MQNCLELILRWTALLEYNPKVEQMLTIVETLVPVLSDVAKTRTLKRKTADDMKHSENADAVLFSE